MRYKCAWEARYQTCMHWHHQPSPIHPPLPRLSPLPLLYCSFCTHDRLIWALVHSESKAHVRRGVEMVRAALQRDARSGDQVSLSAHPFEPSWTASLEAAGTPPTQAAWLSMHGCKQWPHHPPGQSAQRAPHHTCWRLPAWRLRPLPVECTCLEQHQYALS